jgi:hypothetical protein
MYENGKKGPESWENADNYSKDGNGKWWYDVAKYINNNGITKIIIIAGIHRYMCIEKSAVYIQDRSDYLKKLTGVKIEYRLGGSPDEDIILACSAKHFISTGGGYGDLLNNIRQNMNP